MTGRQGIGVARGHEPPLNGNGDFLGEADSDEASGRQGIAIADEVHRVGGGDNLTLLVALEKRESRMFHQGYLGPRHLQVSVFVRVSVAK